MLDDLVQARLPVPAAEGERKARTRGSERLETESGEHPGRAGVPGVRDYERLPGVQRPEGLGSLGLARRRH